jgi:prephenate dehydrogenase
MHCTIGIIGFGRFGRLMARNLAADFRVRTHDPGAAPGEVRSTGAEPDTLESTASADVVVLAVPISAMERVLADVAPRLKPGSLLVDVGSVKELPVEWMRKAIPAGVDLLGTHPMFGPDSAADSLQGRKIVVCPVRIPPERLAQVTGYLSSRGLRVIETTAAEHDRQIAVSLALTHFIGRSLGAMQAEPQEIDTEGYRRLLRILEVVDHDTWQLFEDMHRFNPHAADTRKRFMQAVADIEARLERE